MRHRSWSAALILITGLAGCSEGNSAPHSARDPAASAATANSTVNSGESGDEPVSGSASGHSLPSNSGTVPRAQTPKRRPLATARAGVSLKELSERQERIQQLLTKFQPLLSRVDADTSTVAEALEVLRPLGPEALTVVLAIPRPESDVLPVGRRALLLELCALSSAHETQAGIPDPSLLLNESRTTLPDRGDAGVTLLLFLDSIPYQGEQRRQYWAVLRSVMETSTYAQLRSLAYDQLIVASDKLKSEYMTGFRRAQDGFDIGSQAATIRDVEALGPHGMMLAISGLRQWKAATESELEFVKQTEEARERRKQSRYYSATESDLDLIRRLREADNLPKDVVLQSRLEVIEDALEHLQLARLAYVDQLAQRLGVPAEEDPRNATSDAERSAELANRIGRCWLSRGRPVAAFDSFLDASTLALGQKMNCRMYGTGVCGAMVASKVVGNTKAIQGFVVDAADGLTNDNVTDEQNRIPALASLYQVAGDVAQQNNDRQTATTLYQECENLLDGVRESQPTAEIETYLLAAELWFDAGEYTTAQASLDKISGRLNELADGTPRRVVEALLRSGEAHLSQEKADEAIPILERARALCQTKKLDQLVTEASGLLALAQVEAGNVKVAEEFVASVTKTGGAQSPSLTTLAILDLTVGQVLLQQNSRDEALEFLRSAQVVFEQERGDANYLTRRSVSLLDNLVTAAEHTSTP